MDPEQTTTQEPDGLNIDEAVEGIAESLQLVAPDDGGTDQASEDATPPADTPPAPAPAVPPTAPTDDPAPDTWTKEGKERWAGLSAEIRQEIKKRENDIAKYVGSTNDAVGVAKAFEKMLAPFAEAYTKSGINPWKHTENLLRAHAVMMWGNPQQKVGMFKQLAADSGIDVAKLTAENPTDATGNEYLQHINELQQRINQLEKGVTGVTSTVQAARAAELESGIVAFAKDEEAHPFFWEVADDIQRLIETRAAGTLEQAYVTAIHANPITRAKLIDKEAEKRLATRAASESERASKARKAASASVKSSGKGRVASIPGTIDDTLKEALANIHSREQ